MNVVNFYDTSLGIALSLLWAFFVAWWWLIIPLILYFPARFFHFWWIRWEVWYKEEEWIMLELIPPAEVLKPYLAMEDVINVLWSVYDGANWRERWCEGEMLCGPFWFSFEIVSIGGQVHFYMRILKDQKGFVESIFQNHYPEIEIFQVEDYTQNVPQDMPNETFDLYGEYLSTIRESSYPIKTYKYFEIRPEAEQEIKLDPFSSLMEAMAKLKEGEQVWFQIGLTPITNKDIPWVDEGKALADKIARRPGAAGRKSLIGELLKFVFLDKKPYGDEEKAESLIPPEMKLTPGEKEKLAAIEEKIGQVGFKVYMRVLYVYTKDAFVSPNRRVPRAYVMHFSTNSLNAMKDWSKEKAKIHYFFRKRRLYTRKKKLFDLYVRRLPPLYPKMSGPGNMIMNAEEIATIFHFPNRAIELPAGVPRVLAKKATPPSNLPIE